MVALDGSAGSGAAQPGGRGVNALAGLFLISSALLAEGYDPLQPEYALARH